MLIEYKRNGRRRTVRAKVGEVLIRKGLAVEVTAGEPSVAAPAPYSTRALTAEAPAVDPAAPYGYKADGTPRKRPAPVRRVTENT